jgi:hypothetical protein
MKPTSHSAGPEQRSGIRPAPSNQFPIVASAYHPVGLDGYRGGCIKARRPSFRSISNQYFQKEARNSFATEAAFFATMVVISSWPILLSVRAMTDLVRVFAGA